jgi:hypothetical protein
MQVVGASLVKRNASIRPKTLALLLGIVSHMLLLLLLPPQIMGFLETKRYQGFKETGSVSGASTRTARHSSSSSCDFLSCWGSHASLAQ